MDISRHVKLHILSLSSKQNNLSLGFVYLCAHISKRLISITGNASSKFIFRSKCRERWLKCSSVLLR